MAYKQPGNLDFSRRGKRVGLIYFAKYCEDCGEKVVMSREEIQFLAKRTGCGQVRKRAVRRGIKKALTDLAERL